MRIGTLEVGAGQPCRVCCELSNAHNGDGARMIRLMRAAKDAGADLLKIQAYRPAELVALRGDGPAPEPWGSQGYTMRTLYEKAQTPLEWLPALFEFARTLAIPLFSSVFGAESLAALEAVGCPALKVAHLDAHDTTLARAVVKTGKPILVSTSYEVGHPIAPEYCDERYDVHGIYCPAGYPTRLQDVHLPDSLWGLSSHCLHPLVAPLAVARGARYLEFHFHLHDEPSELEASVSLDQYEFHDMVQSVRQAEVLLG